MIRRIVEYVAADRALAKASLADLADGRYQAEDQSPGYAAAYEHSRAAEEALSPRLYVMAEKVTELVNKRLWVQVFDYEDELHLREIWRGDL